MSDSSDAEKQPSYRGKGTDDDPFIVEFLPNDPRNPMNWSSTRKWTYTVIVTLAVFVVTLTSSAYAASANEVIGEFQISREVFTAGVSLFVLGFAIGPAVWAPLYLILTTRSELYGRQSPWLASHIGMVAFIGGSAGSRNITTLLVLRFLAGTFGGSPVVNSGGVIADLFPPAQRGLAITMYAIAPFLGPILGPVVGGFVSENVGWRWVQGVCCIAVGVVGIFGVAFVPETYGPVLLTRMANAHTDGKVYVSVLERNQGKKKVSQVFRIAITRPWALLIREPVVVVASLYIAILYGTIYMFMGAMPIVYNEGRGWSEGIGGLAFMGMAVGICIGFVYVILDNKRYTKLFVAGKATPEARLPPAMVGAVSLPVGMFAFAWTNFPSIHWAVSIVLTAPFGFSCVLVTLPIFNYMIDSYTIYAASVLAALAITRSLLGAAFPLFTAQMYEALGIHWASSIPGFLTLACMPFPFIMYKYGARLLMKCKYAFEAAEMMKRMQGSREEETKESS